MGVYEIKDFFLFSACINIPMPAPRAIGTNILSRPPKVSESMGNLYTDKILRNSWYEINPGRVINFTSQFGLK
jgi:hypothetical protein